jgi:hypothetical protein
MVYSCSLSVSIFKSFMIKHLPLCLLSYLKTISSNDYNFYFSTIDEYMHLISEYGIHRIITHILLTYAEMVIFKILYMNKFSMIVAMDEYFFTNFVTLLNILINFGLTIIRLSLGEHRRTRLYFHNFAKPSEFYNKLSWP